MNFNEKCLHFVTAAGILEPVRYEAEKENETGWLAIAMKNLIDHLVRVGDKYAGGSDELLKFTDKNRDTLFPVLDRTEKIMQQAFNPRRVGRDAKGRFVKLD